MKQTLKLKWLIVGAFLSSIGTSFIWPLTTIYLHNELHRSLTVIGVVLLLYSGTNVVGSYLGGILFDRFNPQWLILAGLLVDIAAMVALVFHSGWPQYWVAPLALYRTKCVISSMIGRYNLGGTPRYPNE